MPCSVYCPGEPGTGILVHLDQLYCYTYYNSMIGFVLSDFRECISAILLPQGSIEYGQSNGYICSACTRKVCKARIVQCELRVPVFMRNSGILTLCSEVLSSNFVPFIDVIIVNPTP